MAKRVWKSIIRRKNKPAGNMAFGALAVTHEEDCPVIFRVKEGSPDSRAARAANNKRFTINLGVEDLPSVPRPESMAKFYTDDEVGVVKRRRSSLAISSTSGDEEEANPFLMREHMRNEDAERLGLKARPETCYLDKEVKLRERRKSLFMAQEFPISMGGAGRERVHSKRDGMCLQGDQFCEDLKENIPATEDVRTPGSDKVFFGDDADNNPARSPEDNRAFSPSMRQGHRPQRRHADAGGHGRRRRLFPRGFYQLHQRPPSRAPAAAQEGRPQEGPRESGLPRLPGRPPARRVLVLLLLVSGVI
ncbi:uncharacterized protein LOC119577960 [Penaeus monodon]|uniref:uncharacterized protein LOC119577960 n=1 Tax=Penaeus monodon TaxID=6687 RepID=UPI0018A6DC35|nr:uncharacterized protein LOC119577960 [Penaeus monodon]